MFSRVLARRGCHFEVQDYFLIELGEIGMHLSVVCYRCAEGILSYHKTLFKMHATINILYMLQFGRNAQTTPQNQFLVLSRLLGKHEIMRRAFFLDNADTKKLPVARRN